MTGRHRAGDPAATEVVSHVGDGWVEVISVDPARQRLFRELGGRRTGIMGGHWRFAYDSEEQLARLLGRFEELDLPLRHGDPDDSTAPAVVLEQLRARGL